MRPTVSQYAQALEELVGSMSSVELAKVTENFLGLLKRKGDERKLGAIVKYLEKMDAEKKKRTEVTVMLAHEADTETKEKLSSQAEKLFPHKKVELQYEIRKEVIGGAMFRTDEVLYDVTLSNTLKSLKVALMK